MIDNGIQLLVDFVTIAVIAFLFGFGLHCALSKTARGRDQ